MSYFYIDKTECMGDSLVKINSNAASFDSRINYLSSNYVYQLSAGPNIYLTPASGLGNTIAITASSTSISRAWATFDGSLTPALTAGTNIAAITKTGTGGYKINFVQSFPTVNYSAIPAATTTGASVNSITKTVSSCTFTTISGGVSVNSGVDVVFYSL